MRRTNSPRGQTLLEFPVAMWMALLCFGFPLMAFAGFSYRASLLYFGIRTTCSKAAKSPSFSQAINTAQTVWNENLGAWSGMTGRESVCVVGYTNSGGSGGIVLRQR